MALRDNIKILKYGKQVLSNGINEQDASSFSMESGYLIKATKFDEFLSTDSVKVTRYGEMFTHGEFVEGDPSEYSIARQLITEIKLYNFDGQNGIVGSEISGTNMPVITGTSDFYFIIEVHLNSGYTYQSIGNGSLTYPGSNSSNFINGGIFDFDASNKKVRLVAGIVNGTPFFDKQDINIKLTNVKYLSGVATKTENFDATTSISYMHKYTLTLTKNSNVSSISINRTSSPYAKASTGTLLSASGTADIYYGDVLSGSATAATGYTISAASYSNSSVTGNVTWAPTATINKYSVTISAGTGVSSVYLSTNSSATSGSASGTKFNYNTTVYGFAVLAEGYNAASGWSLVSGTANTTGAKYRVGSRTVGTSGAAFGTMNATRKTFTYSTGTLPTGVGSITAYRAPYNSTSSYSTISNGATISYGDRMYFTATAASGYGAPTVSKNSSSNYLTVTGNVIGANYVTGAGVNSYTLTITKGTGISKIYYNIDENAFIEWTSGTVSVPHGSSVICYATPSTGYSYAYNSASNYYTLTESATGNLTYSPAATINTYAVTIAKGTGVSEVYTSTSSTATSGNASGTKYNYNATVYGFAKLSAGYNATSGWTLVSGTANSANAIYRVGSKTVGTSGAAFGTMNATIKTFAVTISAGTGVSSVYLSTSSSATSGDASGTKYNYNTTVYGFAKLSAGYNAASGWTLVSGTANSANAIYRVGSKTTTSDQAFGTMNATIKTFAVTITKGTGVSSVYLSTNSSATSGSASGTNFNYGTTVYGFAVLASGATAPSGWTRVSGTANTAGAKYRVGSKVVGTSGAAFGTINATTNSYTVSITAGIGISQVYLSTSSTATSGDASGTSYSYNTTVYGFVVLKLGYDPSTLEGWVNVGTRTYRVGSVTVKSNQNFGTINAVPKTYIYSTGTLPTGVASITAYRAKYNSTSSYSTISNGTSINTGDRMYFKATASSGYNAPTVSKNSSSNYLTVSGNVTGKNYVTAGSLALDPPQVSVLDGAELIIAQDTLTFEVYNPNDVDIYIDWEIENEMGTEWYWEASGETLVEATSSLLIKFDDLTDPDLYELSNTEFFLTVRVWNEDQTALLTSPVVTESFTPIIHPSTYQG